MNLVTTVDEATNATKGIITSGLILAVQGVEVFGIYDFNEQQSIWLNSVIAFVGLVWIALTRNRSAKRVSE